MPRDPLRVSVVSPVFNAERFLSEAIESVLAQTRPAFELLLIDDGSTDSGPTIAQSYAAAHPDCIRWSEHPGHARRGTSATRNLGLRQARGDVIAFIDADDRWRPEKLAEQLAILDEDPEVDVVCGAVNYWASWAGGTDRIYRTGDGRTGKLRPPKALLTWYPVGRHTAPSMSDILIRRRAVQHAGGFDERFTGFYEEHTFLAKLYMQATIHLSPNVWSDYRQHGESCSAQTARAGDYGEVRTRYLEWLRDYVATTAFRDHLQLQLALERAAGRRRQAAPWAAGVLENLLRKVARR